MNISKQVPIKSNVKIKVKNGTNTKTIKKSNSATNLFLNGLMEFIRGSFKSSIGGMHEYLPTAVGVGTSQHPNSFADRTKLASEVNTGIRFRAEAVSRLVADSEESVGSSLKNQSRVTYLAAIKSGSIRVGTVLKEIGLFASMPIESETLLAYISLNTDDEIEIESSTALQIEWEVTFGII